MPLGSYLKPACAVELVVKRLSYSRRDKMSISNTSVQLNKGTKTAIAGDEGGAEKNGDFPRHKLSMDNAV